MWETAPTNHFYLYILLQKKLGDVKILDFLFRNFNFRTLDIEFRTFFGHFAEVLLCRNVFWTSVFTFAVPFNNETKKFDAS